MICRSDVGSKGGEFLRQLVLIPRATTSGGRRDVYDVSRHRLRCLDTSHSGAGGIRTPDLLSAIQALSQLSYSPARRSRDTAYLCRIRKTTEKDGRGIEDARGALRDT